MERADASCCLSDLGSINTPKCIIQVQREAAMAKGGKKGLDSPPGACAGRSLVEMMEDCLDGLVVWLKDADMENADPAEVAEMKGRAYGVATCIAIVQSPYAPNIDAVRADSVWRYEWRQEQETKKRESWSETGSRASELEEIESGA